MEDALFGEEGKGAGPILVRDVLWGWGKQIEQSGVDFYAHKTGFTKLSLARAINRAGFTDARILRVAELYGLFAFAFKGPVTAKHMDMLSRLEIDPHAGLRGAGS